jgi:hypothetical protein
MASTMLNISERIAALPPEGLQQLADKLLAVQQPVEEKRITRRPRELLAHCPPSYSQERLWVLEQLEAVDRPTTSRW